MSKKPRDNVPQEKTQSDHPLQLQTLEEDWQTSSYSVLTKNEWMLNNPLMSDVCFVVGPAGEEEEYFAHKYILGIGSPVFCSMLYGSVDKSSESKKIEVPDVHPIGFYTMLKLLYTEKISLHMDNILSTLYASHKYIIPRLQDACANFLAKEVNSSNVCFLLSETRLFDISGFTDICWEIIDMSSEKALVAESFVDIDFTLLEQILNRNSLNCREIVIYKAAVRWARAQMGLSSHEKAPAGEIRKIIGQPFKNIRFTQMSPTEFADDVAMSGLLSPNEVNNIFMYLVSSKYKPSTSFPTYPRMDKSSKLLVCHRFNSYDVHETIEQPFHTIRFQVDKPISVVGLGIFPPLIDGSYTTEIQILKLGHSNPLKTNLKLQPNHKHRINRIFFDVPFQVDPNVCYKVSICFSDWDDCVCGDQGMSQVVKDGVKFMFDDDDESETTVAYGQIPQILFKHR